MIVVDHRGDRPGDRPWSWCRGPRVGPGRGAGGV